jgi:hypothetical protein
MYTINNFMLSFIQYLKEESMPIYKISGRPHLPFITAYDNKGGVHQAPFHSETREGKIRYDFTEAGRLANEKGGFIQYPKTKPQVHQELSFHHGINFRDDVFTEGGGARAQHGITLLTFTPEVDDDDDGPPPPEPESEPKLTQKKRLAPSSPIQSSRSGRKISSRV